MLDATDQMTEPEEKAIPYSILEKLPPEAREWAESLPWKKRGYLLSLCLLMCASSPEVQADFLDNYTADGLVSKKLEDKETHKRVQEYLIIFHIKTNLSESILRHYIRQFYIHAAQDVRREPDLYLEVALKLVFSSEERNNVFNYILGFELIKMMFKMSWLQHERLYQMQKNQDEFLNKYIKPIQYAHEINGLVVPMAKGMFFAKRSYFVKQPAIGEKKLIELVMATFTTDKVSFLGFSIIRHLQSLVFDYEYIFKAPEQGSLFPE